MKIILKVSGEHALVLWVGNYQPYVTILLEGLDHKVGDIINSWYHGNYFGDLQAALDDLKKRSGE